MIVQFSNICSKDKSLIHNLETDFPENILTREITAGFDGQTAIQIFCALSPAVITAITQIVSSLLAKASAPTIIILYNDGTQHTINDVNQFIDEVQHEQKKQ